jgi:hypothetical protein
MNTRNFRRLVREASLWVSGVGFGVLTTTVFLPGGDHKGVLWLKFVATFLLILGAAAYHCLGDAKTDGPAQNRPQI